MDQPMPLHHNINRTFDPLHRIFWIDLRSLGQRRLLHLTSAVTVYGGLMIRRVLLHALLVILR